MNKSLLTQGAVAALVVLQILATGCNKSSTEGSSPTTSTTPATPAPPSASSSSAPTSSIQVKGSDTMVNLAQAWAEEYKKVAPSVNVEVSGGGSGVGIAALIKGTIDIADASRNMKQSEIEQAKKNTGKDPKEVIVGYDALAIYVHKDNPLNEITLDQIAQIYAERGTITKWSDL